MKTAKNILLLILFTGVISCEKKFEEHYLNDPPTIDIPLWEAISANPDYSEFVGLMNETGLDSLFSQDGSYTVFVPSNAAFGSFNRDTGDLHALMQYHLLDYVFNLVSVANSRSIQTSGGKFALLEKNGGEYLFSGAMVSYSSPLHKDGRYYELEEIAYPKQNLYEYIALNASILRRYIDEFDSILIDLEKSVPLGFDEEGNTIYDSVYTVVNYFDTLYYPVSEEHRTRTATMILFNDDQYDFALDEMALDMGGGMVSGEDVPKSWQNNVLIPELLSIGMFPNSLQNEDLLQGRIRNILGDTVEVDYATIDPESRTLCSNGIVFNYNEDFRVPRYLYKGEVTIEGEHMVDSVAAGVFFWKPQYKVTGTTSAVASTPIRQISSGARNDSLVAVTFPSQNYEGEFNFEFYFKEMFPQRYQFIWSANSRPSGVYQVFVNDVMVREFDTFLLRSSVPSVVTSERFFPVNSHNRFDALVDFLTEYGDVKITLKYISSGMNPRSDGFNIDYISLIPVDVD